MDGEKRFGRQTPTSGVVLPYNSTDGDDAADLYEKSGRDCYPWQRLLIKDIMGVNDEGLWVHQKFGFEIPRRNGKNEIIAMREFYGLTHGEQMCHTAHRQTTATSAFRRLCKILTDAGYVEVDKRYTKGDKPEKAMHTSKAYGLESIELEDKQGGGRIVFRTRTANGGLGEGFDLLIIDEAQEYTDSQQQALVYTVSDSSNPQTLFCGTPPTGISAGKVFEKMRGQVLEGKAYDTGWAEWSVSEKPDDPTTAIDAWYETNPSMGYHLDERKIRAEISDDILDFLIQRLGYWFTYNLQSAINQNEWALLKATKAPKLTGKLYVGIKYGKDAHNVALSIACKTTDGKVFVECVGCHEIREGDLWIIDFLRTADVKSTVVDGAQGVLLMKDLTDYKIKPKAQKVTASQFILANASFTNAITAQTLVHSGQADVEHVISNVDRRTIGSQGGFGYKAQTDGVEIAILDSMIIAYYMAVEDKGRKKQQVNY